MGKQKVMVVGGAGYIGGAVVDYLTYQGIDVLVYDNLFFERDYRKKTNFEFGDILDTDTLKKAIVNYGPDSIIWLAAMVGDGACSIDPELTIKTNQESVKWLSENYKKRIVFTSTCSVYGRNNSILDEKSPTNPLSLYASTKLNAEKYLQNNDAVIFRLGTLYGVSDEFSRIRMDLVINILASKAILGQPLKVFGGDQWRPLLHVKDAAIAISHASAKIDNIPLIEKGIYNLAKENMKIKQMAERIKETVPFYMDINIIYTDVDFEDQRNYRVSSNYYLKKNPLLKFKKTIEEGILEIMDLIKNGRIKNPASSIHSNYKYVREVNDAKCARNN